MADVAASDAARPEMGPDADRSSVWCMTLANKDVMSNYFTVTAHGNIVPARALGAC